MSESADHPNRRKAARIAELEAALKYAWSVLEQLKAPVPAELQALQSRIYDALYRGRFSE